MGIKNPTKEEIQEIIDYFASIGMKVTRAKSSGRYTVHRKGYSSGSDFSPAQLIAFRCGLPFREVLVG